MSNQPTNDHPHNDSDNDSVASSVPSSLYGRCVASFGKTLNARRLRQAVDNDVQFLQNRLAKLHSEEVKAKQEIDALKKKSTEVTTNKEKHDETATMRRALKDQVDYGKRKEAALIALNKERQAKAVWASKQKVMQDRREAVLTMKKQKEINECRVHIMKEEDREKHLNQRQTIRELHHMAKLKKERAAEQKKEQVRQEYEARLEQEQMERERKEQLAAQLIAQEAQMIYRLKRMHAEKQRALSELGEAVRESNHRASSRSSNNVSPTASNKPAADEAQ